ncbi:MAG TPA: EpsI family protein [Planctomycetota bacterium]|nr:EpsI family protein [Planctomycetota bacterium]
MKSAIVAIAILAVTAGAVVWLETDSQAGKESNSYARRIPLSIGRWKGEELPSSADVERILGTTDLLTRKYFNENDEQVEFAAVFAKDNRRAAHPPEICYKGEGYEIEAPSQRTYILEWPDSGFQPGTDAVASFASSASVELTVQDVVFRKDSERILVQYWFKTGSFCTSNLLVHEWHMLKNNILGRHASNALLRVSTVVRHDQTVEEARALIEDFCRQVFPYTIASMP